MFTQSVSLNGISQLDVSCRSVCVLRTFVQWGGGGHGSHWERRVRLSKHRTTEVGLGSSSFVPRPRSSRYIGETVSTDCENDCNIGKFSAAKFGCYIGWKTKRKKIGSRWDQAFYEFVKLPFKPLRRTFENALITTYLRARTCQGIHESCGNRYVFFGGANHNDLDAICDIYIVPCHKHQTKRTAENVQCLMYLGPEGANRIIFLPSIYSHLLAFVLHLPSFSEGTLQITTPILPMHALRGFPLGDPH